MVEDTVENLSKTIKINDEFRSTKIWSAIIGLNPKKQDGSPVFSAGRIIKLPKKGRPAITVCVDLDLDLDSKEQLNNKTSKNPKNINLYVATL